ncbi:hypothetical protein RJ641_034510 [Dillenia turbinata]|uniref:Uncharacterized protein n=1 Tax=Dillenia turbinata TaxID=194707 RepID=A0AAN8VHU9_9MAGN
MVELVPLTSTRIPGEMSFNVPFLSGIGFCLFATQTTVVPFEIFLNHIPKYRLLEVPGLKNPSSKTPPEETIVFPPSLSITSGNRISSALETLKTEKSRGRRIASLGKGALAREGEKESTQKVAFAAFI